MLNLSEVVKSVDKQRNGGGVYPGYGVLPTHWELSPGLYIAVKSMAIGDEKNILEYKSDRSLGRSLSYRNENNFQLNVMG